MIVSAASIVAPPANTAKRAKHACSSSLNSSMAPVDGRAQRVVAGGRVASGGARSAECHLQTLGDLGGRQQPAAGRGELDRQRQPVDAPADLRDRRGVAVAEIERGIVGSRPLDEQGDCIVAGQCLRVLGRSELGQRERRDGIALLGVQRERLAAGGKHRQRGTGAEQARR